MGAESAGFRRARFTPTPRAVRKRAGCWRDPRWAFLPVRITATRAFISYNASPGAGGESAGVSRRGLCTPATEPGCHTVRLNPNTNNFLSFAASNFFFLKLSAPPENRSRRRKWGTEPHREKEAAGPSFPFRPLPRSHPRPLPSRAHRSGPDLAFLPRVGAACDGARRLWPLTPRGLPFQRRNRSEGCMDS